MKLYGRCNACHQKKFFVRKRQYRVPTIVDKVTSQGELCGKCYRGIKRLIK